MDWFSWIRMMGIILWKLLPVWLCVNDVACCQITLTSFFALWLIGYLSGILLLLWEYQFFCCTLLYGRQRRRRARAVKVPIVACLLNMFCIVVAWTMFLYFAESNHVMNAKCNSTLKVELDAFAQSLWYDAIQVGIWNFSLPNGKAVFAKTCFTMHCAQLSLSKSLYYVYLDVKSYSVM